jgi:hypothetical protein
MPVVWMRAAARCATPSAVQAANGPSLLGGASAALARTLGRGRASGRFKVTAAPRYAGQQRS